MRDSDEEKVRALKKEKKKKKDLMKINLVSRVQIKRRYLTLFTVLMALNLN